MLLRWRPRRRGAAVALAVAAVLAAVVVPVVVPAPTLATAAAARTAPTPGPVVLVGTGGGRWSGTDARPAPRLRSFLARGAVGVMSVRSVRSSTCPVDGWLAVSAGARAADAAGPCRAPAFTTPPSPGGPASVDRWG